MKGKDHRRAVIIGAGPAGLTAAYEFLTRTDITPVVLEKSEYMGGISRTINYKGNRIDIGGHRFFSKSDRVMQRWLEMMPLEAAATNGTTITYQTQRRELNGCHAGEDPQACDNVILVRSRKSRIYFLRRFFDYPISLSKDTLRNLGLWRTFKIGVSYARTVLWKGRREATLEDFFINRFGRELYQTFFKSYTEKVWGVPCSEISAEWGAQRIKGLNITKTLQHALRRRGNARPPDISQKSTETSLIERFLYPKFGPGQMWEETARRVKELGGEIRTGFKVDRLHTDGCRVTGVDAVNTNTGERETLRGDFVLSTAPIKELLRSFDVSAPTNVLEVSDGLVYRDFITVGLLVPKLRIQEQTPGGEKPITDNWIYIQESDVKLGRLQIFNNWSPFMVKDSSTVWLGLEYFCNDSDDLWKMPDCKLIELAKEELNRLGMIDAEAVLDATVIRMEKTYPAYFGTYSRFSEIRDYLDRFENLFLMGRNGMHRYNNQDHSMLTAMVAVDNIIAGKTDKAELWNINTETDYHEEKGLNASARR